MSDWIYINNDFIPAAQATIHVSDLAIQRGYGVFDFIKVCRNNPVFLDDHLDRFYKSASIMHLPVAHSKEALKTIVQDLANRNNLSLSGIRLTLTGGYAGDGYSICTPNLIITQNIFSPPTDATKLKGIHLLTKTHQRQLPYVKTIDYLMPIWLQTEVQKSGADEVLYVYNGIATECPRANLFIVTKGSKLVTPAKNILHGITRNKIIAIARGSYAVEERNVTMNDLLEAAEIFITSTTKGVLSVRQVNEHRFQAPGNVTLHLAGELDRLIQNE